MVSQIQVQQKKLDIGHISSDFYIGMLSNTESMQPIIQTNQYVGLFGLQISVPKTRFLLETAPLLSHQLLPCSQPEGSQS